MTTVTIKEGEGKEVGRRKEEPDQEERKEDKCSRGVKTRKVILDDVGYKLGCSKCNATRDGEMLRIKWRHHTAECRNGVEEKMEESQKWRRGAETAK